MGEKRENNIDVSSEVTNNTEDHINIDSTNIFDEFNTDEKLKNEIKTAENQKKRNAGYYIRIISSFFTTINMLLILISIIIGIYIYIQNKDNYNNISYLNPVCNLLVNDKGNFENCSSVSSLLKTYNNNNNNIAIEEYKNVIPLVEKFVKNENFIDSKEVSFLINKTKNKLRVLEIISEFDKIKNNFSPLNKTKIKCENLKILSDFTIDIECSAYSGIWDGKILGYSGKNKGQDTVNGTSISVASSFINFIEQYNVKGDKDLPFYILEKPRKFSFVEIVNTDGYTRKTDFKLKLKYSNIGLQNK